MWRAGRIDIFKALNSTKAIKTVDYSGCDSNNLGMKFVKIEAGSFMMVSDSGEKDEKPVHKVDIEKTSEIKKSWIPGVYYTEDE